MLSAAEYQAIFEASPDGTIVVDADGVVRDANPQAEELFGWPRNELVGLPIETLVPTRLRSAHTSHREHFARRPHKRPMGVGLDLQGQRRDGTTFPIEISLSPWRSEQDAAYVICSIRDITLFKRLQNFSEGALRATEEERQRIARELHDDTAQRLATLILRVRMLAAEEAPEARRMLLADIREEIVETAEGVKRIARGLRPPELEEVGLVAALQAHFRTLHEGTGFEVAAALEPVDASLGLPRKLAIYRIVQEAISNVRRHADVSRAEVRISSDAGEIVTEIIDQGRGFVTSRLDQEGRGLGLVGMHERAAMIGARLAVDSEPGKGTRVRVSVPASEPTP